MLRIAGSPAHAMWINRQPPVVEPNFPTPWLPFPPDHTIISLVFVLRVLAILKRSKSKYRGSKSTAHSDLLILDTDALLSDRESRRAFNAFFVHGAQIEGIAYFFVSVARERRVRVARPKGTSIIARCYAFTGR